MKQIKIFLLLFIISLFVRLIYLKTIPPSLNWDEISLGYNSFSILKTGKDQWGINFPLIFRAYGDYKLPLYIYFSIPFLLFGLNIFTVKAISILCGSLLPILTYLILQKLKPKNKTFPLIGSLLICFSPWSIFLSRIALEANLFLFLFSISFYFLLSKKYYLSTFFYALCLFSYNSSRVLLPFYLIILFILWLKNKHKINIIKLLPFCLAIFIFVNQSLNQSGQARYKWVSILDEGAINQINNLRGKYPRFIINKATYFTYSATKNYISHFNPKFLFFSGGSQYQFNIPNFYLISYLLIPFFIFGIYWLYKDKQYIFLYFLFVSPIPSAITRDAPHTLRSIAFVYLSSLVVAYAFSKLKNKAYFLIFIITLLISQIQFWPKYFAYSKIYSQSWQYGYNEVVQYAKNNFGKYNQIIITKKYGEPHEFVLFYWPYDPYKYQNNNLVWDYHASWYWVDAFNKFKFINDWEIKDKTKNITSPTLLITSPNNYNNNAKLIKTVYFKDNSPAFDILELYEK